MAESVITEKTRVPLGIAVACILAFSGGAMWIQSGFSDLRQSITLLGVELRADNRAITSRIEADTSDRMRKSEMIRFMNELHRLNPSIIMPEIPR